MPSVDSPVSNGRDGSTREFVIGRHGGVSSALTGSCSRVDSQSVGDLAKCRRLEEEHPSILLIVGHDVFVFVLVSDRSQTSGHLTSVQSSFLFLSLQEHQPVRIRSSSVEIHSARRRKDVRVDLLKRTEDAIRTQEKEREQRREEKRRVRRLFKKKGFTCI